MDKIEPHVWSVEKKVGEDWVTVQSFTQISDAERWFKIYEKWFPKSVFRLQRNI